MCKILQLVHLYLMNFRECKLNLKIISNYAMEECVGQLEHAQNIVNVCNQLGKPVFKY